MPDIGAQAEARFKLRCLDDALLPTKPEHDRLGWDVLVEHPSAPDPTNALDRPVDQRKFLVQVKATRGQVDHAIAKLSALKRLVDDDLPTFVAHYSYGEGSEPERVRLLHVGPRQIEAILKRVRERESRGRTDLHNAKLRLSLDEAVDVGPEPGALTRALLAAAPGPGAEYVARKREWRDRCGFDEKAYRVAFTFSTEVTRAQEDDFFLGRGGSLPVSNFRAECRRFGIPLDKEVHRATAATVSIGPVEGEPAVLVASAPGVRPASMPVQVILDARARLGARYHRARVTNDFIDMTIDRRGRGVKVTFDLDPNTPRALDALSEALEFLHVMAAKGARLELGPDEASATALAEGVGIAIPPILGHLSAYASILAGASRRSRWLEVTSLGALERAFQEQREAYDMIVRPGARATMRPRAENLPRIPSRGVVLWPVGFGLGSMTCNVIARSPVTINSVRDGAITFTYDQPAIVETWAVPTERVSAAEVNARVAALAARENSDGSCIFTMTVRQAA